MQADVVLAVDIGSSAVRAAVVDARGDVLAQQRLARPDSGAGVTFDPELLWTQLVAAVHGLSSEIRARVRSIGIAGHIGSVFVDERLRPLAAGRGWADAAGVELLRARLGSDPGLLLRIAGRPVPTGGAAAAYLQLREDDREAAAQVVHVLSPKDLLVARLTGTVATDRTSAAYTGLSAVADHRWSSELLDALRIDGRMLPPQLASTDVVGEVTGASAAELGLPTGTPVVAGGPDGTVGATFVMGARRDIVADIAGTTDVLVRVIDDIEDAPSEAMVNPYPLGGLSAGGPTGMTGGALARWAALLGFADVPAALAELEGAAARIGPGSDGLRVRTTLSGSRFPHWRSGDAGAVSGQRDHHVAAHFLLAAAEGAALTVREGIERLDTTRTPVRAVVLAGGAARSALLAQLRADVLHRPVLLCPEPDVSLMGAALLALQGVGAMAEGVFRALPEEGRVVHPNAEAARVYDELYVSEEPRTVAQVE